MSFFFLFSTFYVLIFVALCLDSLEREGVLGLEGKNLLFCMDPYQAGCQTPHATFPTTPNSNPPGDSSHGYLHSTGGETDVQRSLVTCYTTRGHLNSGLSVWAQSLDFSVEQVRDFLWKIFGTRCILKFSRVQNGGVMHIPYNLILPEGSRPAPPQTH